MVSAFTTLNLSTLFKTAIFYKKKLINKHSSSLNKLTITKPLILNSNLLLVSNRFGGRVNYLKTLTSTTLGLNTFFYAQLKVINIFNSKYLSRYISSCSLLTLHNHLNFYFIGFTNFRTLNKLQRYNSFLDFFKIKNSFSNSLYHARIKTDRLRFRRNLLFCSAVKCKLVINKLLPLNLLLRGCSLLYSDSFKIRSSFSAKSYDSSVSTSLITQYMNKCILNFFIKSKTFFIPFIYFSKFFRRGGCLYFNSIFLQTYLNFQSNFTFKLSFFLNICLNLFSINQFFYFNRLFMF